MLKIFLLLLAFISPKALANDTACEIPKTMTLNQEIAFPVDCTIQKLKLEKKKLSLVPFKQPPSEVDNGHRLVGISNEGLVLNVTSEGTVFWAMKTEAWKQTGKTKIFSDLMKDEFAKTPEHKKAKETTK